MLANELIWWGVSAVIIALLLFGLGYVRRRNGKAPKFHWMGVIILSLVGGFFVVIALHLYSGEQQDIPEGAGEFELGSLGAGAINH